MIQCFQIGLIPYFTLLIRLKRMKEQKTMTKAIVSWYDNTGFIVIPIMIIMTFVIYLESNAFLIAAMSFALCGLGLTLNLMSELRSQR